MNFKENLKSLRNKKGYTQEQLAKAINISLGALRDWEQGRKEPRNLITLEQLTEILECDYNELLK